MAVMTVIKSFLLGPLPLRVHPLVESGVHLPPGVLFRILIFTERRRQRPFTRPRRQRIQTIEELAASGKGYSEVEERVVPWRDGKLVVVCEAALSEQDNE